MNRTPKEADFANAILRAGRAVLKESRRIIQVQFQIGKLSCGLWKILGDPSEDAGMLQNVAAAELAGPI